MHELFIIGCFKAHNVLIDFCTPFPDELKSDEMCEKLFPVESHTVDYIAAANTARDDRARTVTKTVFFLFSRL